LRCPYCKSLKDKVVDSRTASDGASIRRRRECDICGRRYTTYEKVEEVPFFVIKKNGTRIPFDRDRIRRGVIKACEKRPISAEKIEALLDDIEARINDMFDKEVASKFIGNMVMDSLRDLDQVAYVRFASVYREFKDVNEFVSELRHILERETDGKA
jgi:transcriptional repressor NrdR